jgi:hypothetical protein
VLISLDVLNFGLRSVDGSGGFRKFGFKGFENIGVFFYWLLDDWPSSDSLES